MKNFKNIFMNKKLFNFSKKNFSSNNESKASMFKYTALGIAVGGLGLLSMKNMSVKANYQKNLLNTKEAYNQQVVLKRTKDTVLYFTGGLALTGVITTMMARNPRILSFAMSPLTLFLTLPANFFFTYQIRKQHEGSLLKDLSFLGFNSTISFVLCPLAAFIPAVVLRDAAVLTTGLMGGLGIVALSAKDDAFLNWSGVLGGGLGCLAALSIANIFLNSPVIHNIWLYGGLALFSAVTMYDLKEIQNRAKRELHFDPMAQSISIYMDFINLFVRLAMIMNNRKK